MKFDRLPKPVLEAAQKLVNPKLCEVIAALHDCGMNGMEMATWIHTPNTELEGFCPIEFIIMGKAHDVMVLIEGTKKAEDGKTYDEADLKENKSGLRQIIQNDDDRFIPRD